MYFRINICEDTGSVTNQLLQTISTSKKRKKIEEGGEEGGGWGEGGEEETFVATA